MSAWKFRLAWFAACGALLAACVSTPVDDAKLQGILRAAHTGSDAPLMAAAVGDSSGVIAAAAEGVTRLDGDRAVEMNAPFHIGSVTKTMTAMLAAQLVEEGVLHWRLRLADVFPAAVESGNEIHRDITLEQLLAHATRLPALTSEAAIAALPEFEGDVIAQRRAFTAWVLQQPPANTGRNDESYSNAGYVVLAAMLETVTGQSWEALVRQRIFQPLDMRSAGFGWPCRGADAGCPWGHEVRSGRLVPVDPDTGRGLPHLLAPAGDVHASLPDVLRFAAEYLRAWQGKPALITQQTVYYMLGGGSDAGLGWGVQSAQGFDVIAIHMGSANTFIMLLAVVPQADRAVVVAANAASRQEEDRLLELLRDILRQALPLR